jgi:hypothetical protein
MMRSATLPPAAGGWNCGAACFSCDPAMAAAVDVEIELRPVQWQSCGGGGGSSRRRP